MRLAVTGGRDHEPGPAEIAAFEDLWQRLGGTILFEGGCRRAAWHLGIQVYQWDPETERFEPRGGDR